jgi:AraC family transcriptional regulator of adaptative response/methylated-DNA-[protein]-cysteine methyltransferase
LRRNTAFFETTAEAEAAGLRPCKRCRPTEVDPRVEQAELLVRACRLLERADEPTRSDEVAASVGLTQHYFQRLFKGKMGVTPQEYRRRVLAERAKRELAGAGSVTEAVYAAGYGASSRFYDEAGQVLGMSPTQFKNGAPGVTIRAAVAPTYLGPVLVAATERGVCAIEFGDSEAELRQRLRDRFPGARLVEDDPAFAAWVGQVVAFLEAPRQGLALPLDIQGTAFQRRGPNRGADGRAGGGPGLCRQQAGGGGAVSPGRPPRRRPGRLPLGRGPQAGAAGARVQVARRRRGLFP